MVFMNSMVKTLLPDLGNDQLIETKMIPREMRAIPTQH